MEVSLEAIISLVGLFVGGGGGAFFMWKYQKRKAKAEAENAEIDAAKELQGMYQTMLKDANEYLKDAREKVDGLRHERDHYKQERDEVRENLDKLTRNVSEWKRTTDDTIDDLRRQIARNGRQIEAIRPFMCGDLSCKKRQRVTISDDGTVKTKRPVRRQESTTEIEPLETEEL